MDSRKIMEHMHKLHLILADELKRICEKHHIGYFMIAGTLLGAVRHKGFIPWDDDMDFGMLRSDFEKFLEVCSKELNTEKFYLQTDRNDKYYTFNFAKLRLNGTKVLEGFSSNVATNQGIYIDIFPIDNVSDQKIKAAMQLKSFWFFRNLLWVKCGYGEIARKNQLSYKVAKIIGFLFSISLLKKMKLKSITLAQNEITKMVVTSDGTYGLEKETLRAEWINNIINYNFEDRVYPGIADFEEYLSYFYGDYMKMPPKNKQNHHARIEVDFGPYNSEHEQ